MFIFQYNLFNGIKAVYLLLYVCLLSYIQLDAAESSPLYLIYPSTCNTSSVGFNMVI